MDVLTASTGGCHPHTKASRSQTQAADEPALSGKKKHALRHLKHEISEAKDQLDPAVARSRKRWPLDSTS